MTAHGSGRNKGQKMPYSTVRAFDGEKPFRQGHWGLGAAQYSLRDSMLVTNRRGRALEARVIDRATGKTVWEPKKCAVCRSAWATELGPEPSPSEWSLCEECEEVGQRAADYPVAWRRACGGELYCLRCPVPGEMGVEVASEDLPEGGICTGCGTDVLIPTNAPKAVEETARRTLYAADRAPNQLPDADPSALIAALDRLNISCAVWTDGTVGAIANGILWTMQAAPHAVTGKPCGVWEVSGPAGCRGNFVAAAAARFVHDRRTP